MCIYRSPLKWKDISINFTRKINNKILRHRQEQDIRCRRWALDDKGNSANDGANDFEDSRKTRLRRMQSSQMTVGLEEFADSESGKVIER